MKRLIVALLVGGVFFGAVYGLASTLIVGFGTAATGEGDVGSCGDVTGSTYVLKGQGVADGPGGDDYLFGFPTDITKATHVNIETVAGCDQINAFVQVEDIGGAVLATGSCQISGDGVQTTGPADDGLGYDEGFNSGDNLPGCTALLSAEVDVADIESLVVTMT